MKKALLLLLSLSAILYGYSQTTIETALPLQEGEISYTFESGQEVVYYSYTAPETQGKLVSFTKGEGTPNCQMTEDGTYDTMITAMYSNNYNTTSYPVNPGQKVYLAVNCYSATSFTFTIAIADANVSGGNSCDDVIVIGENETFVPSKYNRQTYEQGATYLSYTAPEDGVLELTFSGSVSNCEIQEGCDGVAQSIAINSGSNSTYIGKHPVVANTTYIMKVYSYSPVMVSTAILHLVEGQSCDLPFKGAETNVLPKEAGTYWYGYDVSGTGYLKITSESSLAGGTLSVWSSCTAYQADASIDGYFALRTRVDNSNYSGSSTTYLICIEKNEATAEDETFNIVFEDEQAGDSEYNTIAITADEEVTVSQFNGTYYYSITAPEGASSFLVVDATQANITNSNTQVAICEEYNTYSPLGYGTNTARAEVNGGQKYIIKWTCNEGYNAFKFKVYFEQITKGESCNDPLTAVVGANDLKAGNNKYYTYTATKTGWLVIDTDVTIDVTFLRGCDQYSGTYYATKIANINKTELKEGETCIIEFGNIEEETTFFLSEENYAEGESCETATNIEIGATNLPGSSGSYWYSFVAPKDGMLTITSDIIYEQAADYSRSSSVIVKTTCEEYGNNITSSDASGTIFKGNFVVAEGDKLYINVVTISAQEGKTLNLAIRDLEPGEGCSTPITITTGELTLPIVDRNNPVWYSIYLNPGAFSVKSSNYGYFDMYLYDSCNTDNYLTYTEYDYNAGGYTLKYDITTSGDYLLKLSGSYNSIVVTVDCEVTSVESVEKDNNIRIMGNNIVVTANNNRTDVAIYDITGKVVAAQAVYDSATFTVDNGIYIVKVGEQVTKVAIR